MIFLEKYFSCYILLIDEISLSECLDIVQFVYRNLNCLFVCLFMPYKFANAIIAKYIDQI